MGVLAQDLSEERAASGQDRLVRPQLTILTSCGDEDRQYASTYNQRCVNKFLWPRGQLL